MPFIVWCAKRKFNEGVKFLLEHGADLNATDVAGNTALGYALINKDEELIKILKQKPGLDRGAESMPLEVQKTK